jgi:hypothetical protein
LEVDERLAKTTKRFMLSLEATLAFPIFQLESVTYSETLL